MAVLTVLFFLSGATGLVYESVWGRELHLLFGTSQFAIATVLAAFMTGLALGGFSAARWLHRIRRPLRAYALLEGIIATYALGFPWLRGALEPLTLAFWRETAPSPLEFGVFQFFLVGAALLIPTACMGATLPILTRHLAPAREQAGAAVGRLYGINTAGAVLGVWAAGFWLLPTFGVRTCTILAAATNLLLAAGALWLDRSAPSMPVEHAPDHAPLPRVLLLVAGLAGASSLALEVAWFRLLTLILGASTYAFSVMLLAFLAGIATGGPLGGYLAARIGDRRRVVIALVWCQLGVAALSWGAMWLYPSLPVAFVQGWYVIKSAPELLWPMKCALAALLMLPPAIGMGATFPFLVHAATSDDAARPAGGIYAANTLGSIFGAFLGGFVLLPVLHVTGTVLACIGVNLAAAACAASSVVSRRALAGGLAVGGAAYVAVCAWPPPWDPMMMTSGVYMYVDAIKEPSAAGIRRTIIDRYRLLYYNEGLSTVVTVARNRVTDNVWLANNGKVDASTTSDMPTQVLVAHTPFLFSGDRTRKAMLIGLASGITLGAMTLHPELERIDVVELEPTMPEAAALFARWNHDALNDPRVRLIANDGRNQLLLTPPGTYDLIVAEPSNPWLTGVSNLFTHEFFKMGKARLAPAGIWSQWVQMYGMDSRDLRSIIATFCDVYAYVLLFSTIRDADLVMVGSDAPIRLDAAQTAALINKNVGLEAEMLQVGIADEIDLLADFLFDRDVAVQLTAGTPFNTDDNLLVEFSAPKNLHRDTSSENFLMLLPFAQTPLAEVHTVDGLFRLARSYFARDEPVRALFTLKEIEAREPGRADTQELYSTYQQALLGRLKP